MSMKRGLLIALILGSFLGIAASGESPAARPQHDWLIVIDGQAFACDDYDFSEQAGALILQSCHTPYGQLQEVAVFRASSILVAYTGPREVSAGPASVR